MLKNHSKQVIQDILGASGVERTEQNQVLAHVFYENELPSKIFKGSSI